MFVLNEMKALDDETGVLDGSSAWEDIPTKEFTPVAKERDGWREVWVEDTITDAKPMFIDDDPWSLYTMGKDDIGGEGGEK